MIVCIENDYLSVAAESDGAQLKSVRSKITGREYLWQGDPAYWTGRAYNLFPIIGRMTGNKYTYENAEYEMLIHGFIRRNELKLKEYTSTKMVFELSSNEDTLKQYPFGFEFNAIFEVIANKLDITYRVVNKDNKEIIFGVGGHPGFNIPFAEGVFEDYYVEFPYAENVKNPTMTDSCYMTGEAPSYELCDNKVHLKHSLFDRDVIILTGTNGVAYIKSDKTNTNIKFIYPDMKYLGLWHKPKTDAPFICLEPWSALPAKDGVVEDISEKADMTHLGAGEIYTNTYTVEINE